MTISGGAFLDDGDEEHQTYGTMSLLTGKYLFMQALKFRERVNIYVYTLLWAFIDTRVYTIEQWLLQSFCGSSGGQSLV